MTSVSQILLQPRQPLGHLPGELDWLFLAAALPAVLPTEPDSCCSSSPGGGLEGRELGHLGPAALGGALSLGQALQPAPWFPSGGGR